MFSKKISQKILHNLKNGVLTPPPVFGVTVRFNTLAG